MNSSSLAHNEVVKFIDSILPFFELSLNHVKEAIKIYNLQKNTRARMYGDTIQMCTEPMSDCLYYFPSCKEEVGKLMMALSEDKKTNNPLVRLMDVLVVLTIVSRGRMKEKSELLYSFFALAEPEGMLEYEHAGLIFCVACCLKRLGALKHLDLTEEDASHLAFLARIRSDSEGFFPSLSFSEFFLWVQNSTESNVIFTFVRQLNRLIEICVSMDGRVDALLSMMTEIASTPSSDIGLPKLDPGSMMFVPVVPQLLSLQTESVSFLLPSNYINATDLYVQIDYIHHTPSERYELSNRLKGKRAEMNPKSCCEKTYRTPSRARVHSAPKARSLFCDRSRNMADSPSTRIDVGGNLHAETEYMLTFYTDCIRFPPVLLTTLPPVRQSKGGTIKIFPASLNLSDFIKLNRSLCSGDGFPDGLLIFTGSICNIDEAFHQIYNSVVGADTKQLSLQKYSLANTVQAVVESFYQANWKNDEELLFSMGQVPDAAIDGLAVELTGKNQVICIPGSCYCSESDKWFKKFRDSVPADCFVEVDRTLKQLHKRLASACSYTAQKLDNKDIRLYVMSCNYLSPSTVTQEVYDMWLKHDSLQQKGPNHIVLLVRTPAELMKASTHWHEDDRVYSKQPQDNQPSVKLRGKHELIHGAYTKNASLAASGQSPKWTPFDGEEEIREGGDRLFRAMIRSLHKWLTQTTSGSRRVTIMSYGWVGGFDFCLALDGDLENFISHISLENTMQDISAISNDATIILNRIENSFNSKVSIEIGPRSDFSRTASILCSNNTEVASMFDLKSISLPSAESLGSGAGTPMLLRGVKINPHLRLHDLSSNMAILGVKCSGFGYVVCSLYEVPYMLTCDDTSRLISTELSSMHPIHVKYKRIVGDTFQELVFDKLTPFCAYCVIVSASAAPPPSDWKLQTPNSVKDPIIFSHFRTFEKCDATVSTSLLAGVSTLDYSSPSHVIDSIMDQLDGARRPMAAPVLLIESDSYHTRPPKSFGSNVRIYSNGMKKLFRMAHVVHCGLEDHQYLNESYDYDKRVSFDKKCGGINISINGKFCRVTLLSNTAKSLQKLFHSIYTTDDFDWVENIQIFSPRPLVPHMENIESSQWKQSRHFTSKLYFDALSKAVNKIMEWKESKPGRDCQIYSVVHISEPVISYIHRVKQPVFSGIRHFTLPIFTGTKSEGERVVIPFGINRFSDQFHFGSYLCNNSDIKGDLPPGNPCQIVYPLFHLHGLNVPDFSSVSKKILYKVVSFTGFQEDDEEDSKAAIALYGYHHHVIIKMITEDVDNIELVLGPIVGNVTYSSCSVLFEANREVCKLKCILRAVGNFENAIELVQRCDAYSPVKFEFQDVLLSGMVYEIFIPEIYGEKALGKFRTLSRSSMYSEMIFIGDEHLEFFPVADIICEELAKQQVINFNHLQFDAMVKKYVSDMKVLRNPLANNRDSAPSYRRPWNVLGERMKGLACTTSAVFHIGSHALLSRLVRALATPFIEIVKKYNLDDEEAIKESALSKLYYIQLVQVVEDSLRLVWVIEPSIKDVFQSASNIPLYNVEYWLSEEDIWGKGSTPGSERDLIALDIIRQLYQKSLIAYIYTLRNWNRLSYNHFFKWSEGTVAVAALDQASEQLESMNKSKLQAAKTEDEVIEAQQLQEDDEDKDDEDDEEETEKADPNAIKAKTFSANFMSENQWKQIRQILVDKSVTQLVIVSQYPLVPLRSIEEVELGSYRWEPPEDDVIKFFDQLFKWLSPKKASTSGKTVTLVSTSDISYSTNIRHLNSGMNIQQICLGKFSCVSKAFLNDRSMTPSDISPTGKLGGMKYIHRTHGLDVVSLDSSRLGGGGRYTGDLSLWHRDSYGVYGVLKFWFDSWMATGTMNLNHICPTGSPEAKVTNQAVVLVGPIVGAPYITYTKDGDRMMVPILIEVDRDIDISMIATDLFSGKQLTRSMHLQKLVPVVIRVGPLRLDTRYTIDINEGIQNAHDSRIVLHTFINWSETNIVLLNAETNGAEDPAKNSSDYVRDLINRFTIPFHGLSGVLHTNVHVDVSTVLDEVKTMPGLSRIIDRVKNASSGGVSSMLVRFVRNVMDRIRVEYRLFLSKPSYRELLLKGFNIFMCRDESLVHEDEDENGLMSLLNLIVSRVRQEYFDQFICQDDRIYSAFPRVKTENEQAVHIKREHSGESFIGDMMVLTADNIADRDILKIPKVRKPDRIYFDPKDDAAECILQQWIRNLIPPPPLWIPWVSPNGRVRIEACCSTTDENIREIHDIIMKSNVETGARIIVLPSIGNLLNPQCRLGYKLQEWITTWIGKDSSRSISLVCPSFNGEGTYLCSIDYFDGYAQLIVQMLNSVFCSNEKVIAKAKRDKLAVIKKKTVKTSSSRKAIAKRKELEAELKAQMQVELDALFNELTTDGYVIYESKNISGTIESTEESVTVVTAELKSISSKTDESVDEYGNLLYPKPTLYDHIYLPPWFSKFCPGTPGVFVQDEVNFVLRHDPNYRSALNIIELDENLFQDMQRVYEASPLSEKSRPPDLREVDIEIPGVTEMSLENAIEKIWLEILPIELKGRMLTLTDSFVRSFCSARAFADIETSLSSSMAFATSMRVLILGAIQLFLACKMATGAESDKWQYILDGPEFPEDFDEPYVSDDDSSSEEEEEEEEEEETAEGGGRGGDGDAGIESGEGGEGNGGDSGTGTTDERGVAAEGSTQQNLIQDSAGVKNEANPDANEAVKNEEHLEFNSAANDEQTVSGQQEENIGPSDRDALAETLYGEVYQVAYRRVLKRRVYGKLSMFMNSSIIK